MSALTLYQGRVWHGRRLPVLHQFSYRHLWIALELDERTPATLRMAPGISWQQRHHGPRDGSPLLAWLAPRLAAAGVTAWSRIELHTLPALWGRVFNPVSFYLVLDEAGALRAVWVEVSNTFGQFHDYCLHHADQRPMARSDRFDADKALHVSPFFQVEGRYCFRFARESSGRFAVRIEYLRDGERSEFVATQQGAPVSGSRWQWWRLMLGCGLMATAVWLRIHWQALQLWRKNIPFFGKNGHAAVPPHSGASS